MLDCTLLGQTKKYWPWLALSVVFGGLGGLLVVYQAWVLSGVINRVFLFGQTLSDSLDSIKILLGLIVLRGIFRWVSEFGGSVLAARIKADLRISLFTKLFNLGPLNQHGQQSGELATLFTQGIEKLDAYFSKYLPQLALSAIIPITILFFVFPADILSGVVFLLTAPLIPFFMILIGKHADQETKRQWHLLGALGARFLETMQGLETLKILGRSKDQTQVIAKSSHDYAKITIKVLRIAFLSALALELLSTLSTAVVAVEIGLRLLTAKILFRQALFILILAPEYYLPLRNLGLQFHAGMEGVAAAQRIFSVLDQQSPPQPIHQAEHDFANQIVFRGVAADYGQIERFSLDDISFSIRKGQRIALVGPSGSGKSTIASMLLRFIQPSQGEILVDGLPLDDIALDHWRRQVAWVGQKPSIFAGSIKQNLLFAKPDAAQGEIEHACKIALLDDLIQSLPGGYDTEIGEGGKNLSGGEIQRLAVARAFLRSAPILILDEVTAQLDPESEEQLQHAFENLLQEKTVLMIAHRLRTVQRADQIIFLQGGRVLERGTHVELLDSQKNYAQFISAYQGAD